MRFLRKILLLFAFLPALLRGQDSTKVFPIQIVESGLLAASEVGLSLFWYEEFERFSFQNDNQDWLQMDKAGHFMSSYQVAKANWALCELSGLSEKKAKRWSIISTTAFYTGIEILDGFAKDYGFSWGDFLANEAGIALILLPNEWQQRFSFRYSYVPTQFPSYRPEIFGSGALEQAFKDYNGQSYWLSLWQKPRDKWYHFIGISLGYGADGMLGGSDNPDRNAEGDILPKFDRTRTYALALDFDLQGLAVGRPKWQKVLRLLDFIKIPLPGVRLAKGLRPEYSLGLY